MSEIYNLVYIESFTTLELAVGRSDASHWRNSIIAMTCLLLKRPENANVCIIELAAQKYIKTAKERERNEESG